MWIMWITLSALDNPLRLIVKFYYKKDTVRPSNSRGPAATLRKIPTPAVSFRKALHTAAKLTAELKLTAHTCQSDMRNEKRS